MESGWVVYGPENGYNLPILVFQGLTVTLLLKVVEIVRFKLIYDSALKVTE